MDTTDAPEISRAELQRLLHEADRVTGIATEATALVSALTAPDQAVDIGMRYLAEDGHTVLLLPPGHLRLPENYFAFEELKTTPGSFETIAEFRTATVMIPELRNQAAAAAPGLLARVFARQATRQARAAAARLDLLLNSSRLQTLTQDTRRMIGIARAAHAQQAAGPQLFPGAHGTPQRFIDLTRRALEQAAGKGPLSFLPYDATTMTAVLARARQLAEHPDSEPRLRAEAEKLLAELTAERADLLLRQLPVDALRTVTSDRLRTTGLDQIRVNSVADVLGAATATLRQVPGIGQQTASRLKAAAETLRREAVATHTTGIGDIPTATATALVRVLARFDRSNTLDEVERARRRRILQYAQHLPESTSPEAWVALLTGTENTNPVWARFTEDIAWTHAHPESLAPSSPVGVGSETWADYLARPAHYQGLLATLLDLEVEGAADLDATTLEQVRSLRLDRTHLVDLHLRGYQSFGARFAVVQGKVILGDEMGLGKTVQALAAAAHISATNAKPTHTLVICPASVMVNWVRESRRFTDLPVYQAHGTAKDDTVAAWQGTGGICVVTFDGARTMNLGAPEFVIIDEAHMIKNPATQRTRAARRLIDTADHALLLTGTPLENRVEEFANLISYVAPDLLHTGMETMTATDFRARIAPAYLRRNQTEVLDELPEKIEQVDWIELHDADRTHYDHAVADANWMAMRRAPMTTPEELPAKLDRITDIVAEAAEAGRKVLIFTYFLDVITVLEKHLAPQTVGTVTGAVAPGTRQQLIDALDSAPAGSVLLAQITAGGTGLNIQSANVVVLVEPQVKPSTEAQAIARVHRMGQTAKVLVHRLIAENTADELMLEKLADKTQLFDAYARPSESAQIPDAVDISESDLAASIITEERQRLGYH